MASKSPPPKREATLPFNCLAKHLERQVRGSTEQTTVSRYRTAMKNGEKFPPLSVADVGGALVLVDGFHRRAAYEALGICDAEAEIFTCRSLDEAEWEAFKANMRHGQRLKAKAFRPAFRAYIRAKKHIGRGGTLQSYREIAHALVEVSYSTIRRWMEVDFPDVFAALAGGPDDADGGVQPGSGTYLDVQYELTQKALDLLDDAKSLMDGVASSVFKRRVSVRASELALLLDLRC